MTHRKHRLLSLAAALLFALPAAAMADDYTYLEGGFLDRDNGRRADDSGLRIAGSGSITRDIALIGEYADTGNFEQFSAGAIFHAPIERGLDWFAGATLEFADAGRDDDTGFGLRGGLRWRFARAFELSPEIRHVRLFDSGDTSLRVAGLFRVAPQLDLQAALQAGDDDRIEAGLRYTFGPSAR
ncbi:hypothetical protein AAG565_10655 [Fontimonas sp. SYSU GA230001]|uniref:hypothetical protein n=1 Tax=Fontimonas sp. SYSU GA230001 TaxID=3142450 RepID=UPI0032B542D7